MNIQEAIGVHRIISPRIFRSSLSKAPGLKQLNVLIKRPIFKVENLVREIKDVVQRCLRVDENEETELLDLAAKTPTMMIEL